MKGRKDGRREGGGDWGDKEGGMAGGKEGGDRDMVNNELKSLGLPTGEWSTLERESLES